MQQHGSQTDQWIPDDYAIGKASGSGRLLNVFRIPSDGSAFNGVRTTTSACTEYQRNVLPVATGNPCKTKFQKDRLGIEIRSNWTYPTPYLDLARDQI